MAVAAIVLAGAAVFWWRRGPAFVLTPNADQNVLLVTIDTLRADALSVYGGPADTPNLDRLANSGARFTFAHAHAVVTLVSHTSILTGLFPYQHGVRDNSGYRLQAGTPTLATRLKALGFATGAFIGGFPLTKRFGLTPGFDEYDDQMPEVDGPVAFSMPERRAEVVVSRATAWIGQQTTRFFAWVHCFDPHSPYRPPEPYATTYRAQPYYGEIAYVDHALEPLFDQLATLSRPTLVIVTADHGESLGEHGEMTHGMFAYEATLHIPLIVAEVTPHRPRAARGVVIETPVRHVDIVPTVLDAVGAAADRSLPGASLLDLIRTGQGGDRPEYFESMTYNLVRGWAPLRGVLVARDKYIDLPIPELYNLLADPKELNNLAGAERDRLHVMANTLGTYNTAPPNQPGQESAETLANLRSLGYVTGHAPARTTYTEADDPKRLVNLDSELHTATEQAESGRTDEAIATLNAVIAQRPDTSDAYIAMAVAYWGAGRVHEAIATLERALAHGVPGSDVRIRLGIYLAESHENPTRAIAVLEGLPGNDVEALNALGIAYSDAGKYPQARATFTRLLTLDATNGLAYQNLAFVALSEAQAATSAGDAATKIGEAERFATKAVQLDPSLSGAYTTLGVVYDETGRVSQAIESWKHAVDLDGTEFRALYDLWRELARAGRTDEAKTYGRQFVATAPPALFQSDLDEVRRYLGGG